MPRPNIFLSSEFSPSQQILSVVALWASAQLPRSSPEPPANKVSQTTRSSSDERAFSPASGSNSQPQVIPHTPGDRPSPPPDCHSHPVAVTSPFPMSRPLPLHPHEVAGQLSDKDFQAPPSGLLRTCRSENGSLIKISGRCMRVTCTISRYTQRKGREAGSSVCLSVCSACDAEMVGTARSVLSGPGLPSAALKHPRLAKRVTPSARHRSTWEPSACDMPEGGPLRAHRQCSLEPSKPSSNSFPQYWNLTPPDSFFLIVAFWGTRTIWLFSYLQPLSAIADSSSQ